MEFSFIMKYKSKIRRSRFVFKEADIARIGNWKQNTLLLLLSDVSNEKLT